MIKSAKEAREILAKGEPHAQYDCDLYIVWKEARAYLQGREDLIAEMEPIGEVLKRAEKLLCKITAFGFLEDRKDLYEDYKETVQLMQLFISFYDRLKGEVEAVKP